MTTEEKLKIDLERSRLEKKVMTRNLAEQSNGSEVDLIGALKAVPVNKMLEQIQYLENDLLPRVEKNRGSDSADFKFYQSIVDTLMWSILILDRYEKLVTRHEREKVYCQMLAERAARLEQEMKIYETYEDALLMGDYMKIRLDTVAKKIGSLLEKK